jgi:hypothetical protein
MIPANQKFKIFISALTQLNIDNVTRLATTDNRLIRRIVRDYQYRGTSAVYIFVIHNFFFVFFVFFVLFLFYCLSGRDLKDVAISSEGRGAVHHTLPELS